MLFKSAGFIFLQNAFKVICWFLFKKKAARVIFFKIPSSVLYSYLDLDIPQTITARLDTIYQQKLFDLDIDTMLNDDRYYHNIKRIAKISWIITSLNKNGLENPIQLLQSSSGKYFCHPGTDRAMVLTYIVPVEEICGFYIWYQDLDPEPFVLDYTHMEISNPFKFLQKFKYNKNFSFKSIVMHEKLDVSDKINGNAIFSTAKGCFCKISNQFCKNFLTYYDSTQWKEISTVTNLAQLVNFKNTAECTIADVTFKKIDDHWIPQYTTDIL